MQEGLASAPWPQCRGHSGGVLSSSHCCLAAPHSSEWPICTCLLPVCSPCFLLGLLDPAAPQLLPSSHRSRCRSSTAARLQTAEGAGREGRTALFHWRCALSLVSFRLFPLGEEAEGPPSAPPPLAGRAKGEVPGNPARRRARELAALQRVHPNVLARVLKQGAVYQDEEVVVLNKPYGLPVHGGPGIKNCVTDVLPILAKMLENMRSETLHLCHRLDKETTGVMVLARSKEAADRIRLLFKTRQVEKIYWAISVGHPNPAEGIVEIPMVEKEVQSHQPHYKMTLAPNYRLSPEDGKVLKTRKNRSAESAVTRYRVLASSSACSLLELQPITAAEYMLSDALLPDPSGSRAKGLRLELPSDRILKFIAVGLPLFLVSLAFAREFSAGSQISCFSPSNFTGKQSAYADTACWDSLLHHGFDAEGHAVTKSLWVLKVFPYSLLVVAVLMYLPYLLWRYAATPALHSDLLFIIDELDKSYNRSVRLVQHMRKVQQSSTEPEQFWEEYERARQERYFEFPLLERYLVCKQHSHSLVIIYLLRNLLLLLFLAATCLYLVFLHLNIFFQDEFSCSIKTGLLQAEPHVPPLIPCKLVFFSVFQLISLAVGGVYVLLMPVVIYNALQLCQWDKGFLSVYEMLPAFDLLSRKMLTCPINDLNIILLFLRANISELTSFSRLSAVSALREATADKQDIDTVVDFMTLLAGLEASKPKYEACVPMANGEAIEMKPGAEAKGKATRDSLGSA